jgi:DNA (cytosine-5)-methyltransferase 1
MQVAGALDTECGGNKLTHQTLLNGHALAVGALSADDGEQGLTTVQAAASGMLVPARMVAFGEYVEDGTASAMKARDYKDATDLVAVDAYNQTVSDTSQALSSSASDIHHTGGAIVPAISKSVRTMSGGVDREDAHTLIAAAIPIQEVGKRTGKSTTDVRAGIGIGQDNDSMFTLQSGAQHGVAVAFANRTRDGVKVPEVMPDGITPALTNPGNGGRADAINVVAPCMAVRRLTPTECERLQGFPDGHTQVPWKKKPADQCPDGPRYKALGNSMAVNCMEWIGQRIDFYDKQS